MANAVDNVRKILAELELILNYIDEKQTEHLVDKILATKEVGKKVYIAGVGRSSLMIRSFAMRLMHLDIPVYVVGETVTPAIQEGDLLIIGSGSGETSTLTILAKKAKKEGVQISLITRNPSSTLGSLADCILNIPIEKGKSGFQPSGSTFEQCMLLICDAMVIRMMEKSGLLSLGVSIDDIIKRKHANLE